MSGLRVVMLGRLAVCAGWREREVPATGSVSELIGALSLADPELGATLSAPGVRVAVNQTILPGDTSLRAGDEVAFLPIYSGG